MIKKVKVKVPATSANLGSGFDVLGVSLNLFNEVHFEVGYGGDVKKKGVDIRIAGEGAGVLPEGAGNIIFKAAKKIFDKRSFKFDYCCIKAVNRIPLARGLGSSSSAILAGMLAANSVCGNHYKKGEILNFAAHMEGHPDNVAPALYGGFCITVKTDSGIEVISLKPPKDLCCVLCVPDFKVSTKKARRLLPGKVSHKDAVFNVSRVALLVGILENHRLELLNLAMDDKLHQPYRRRLIPGLNQVFGAAKKAGAYGAALSGAGPCVTAFCRRGKKKAISVGKNMVMGFRRAGVKSNFRILDFEVKGAKVL